MFVTAVGVVPTRDIHQPCGMYSSLTPPRVGGPPWPTLNVMADHSDVGIPAWQTEGLIMYAATRHELSEDPIAPCLARSGMHSGHLVWS